MKWIVLGVGLGAAFLFLPQVMESSSSACGALERRIVAVSSTHGPSDQRVGSAVIGSIMAQASDGAVASAAAQQQYPSLPPQVGCATLYWRLLADPNQRSS